MLDFVDTWGTRILLGLAMAASALPSHPQLVLSALSRGGDVRVSARWAHSGEGALGQAGRQPGEQRGVLGAQDAALARGLTCFQAPRPLTAAKAPAALAQCSSLPGWGKRQQRQVFCMLCLEQLGNRQRWSWAAGRTGFPPHPALALTYEPARQTASALSLRT